MPLDYRGAVLMSAGMGLLVLGLQQSSVWGWGIYRTLGCIVARRRSCWLCSCCWELRQRDPLIQLRIFSDRASPSKRRPRS